MPGLDILKDWNALKKQGWPALVVAVIFTGYELLAPKDPTCLQEVKYLQEENRAYRMGIVQRDSIISVERQKLIERDTVIKAYREKVVPVAKHIIKEAKK